MDQLYLILEPTGQTEADKRMREGVALHRQGKIDEAEEVYKEVLRLDPRHAFCMNNIALLHVYRKDMNEALLAIERASMADPKASLIHTNWSFICMASHRVDEALKHAPAGVQYGPNGLTHMALASVYMQAGMAEEAITCCDNAIAADSTNYLAHESGCHYQSLTDETPHYILQRRKRYWEMFRFKGEKIPLNNILIGDDRPLRIGYVSGDFRTHSAPMLFSAICLRHSEDFIPYFYSTYWDLSVDDEVTKRYARAAGSRWRDISRISDEKASEIIRNDHIDILVDLSGHSSGGRLGVFSRRSAPVQVTAWGFALGTGCTEMDYFLADDVIVQPNEKRCFTEEIISLPCAMTLDLEYLKSIKFNPEIPFNRKGHITFGCFGRYQKVSAKYLAAVRQVLLLMPAAHMHFQDCSYKRPYSVRRILEALNAIGPLPEIEPSRISFSDGGDWRAHIESYQSVDIVLDPFPHTGGLTSMEQIYMGVPMVTRYGKNTAGRLSASLLTAIGHPELIAQDVDEYCKKAVELAKNPERLSLLRRNLRREFVRSPVISGYVDRVEDEFRKMWGRYKEKAQCQSQPVQAQEPQPVALEAQLPRCQQ